MDGSFLPRRHMPEATKTRQVHEAVLCSFGSLQTRACREGKATADSLSHQGFVAAVRWENRQRRTAAMFSTDPARKSIKHTLKPNHI